MVCDKNFFIKIGEWVGLCEEGKGKGDGIERIKNILIKVVIKC